MSLVCIRLGGVSTSFRRSGQAVNPVPGRRPEVYTGPRKPGGSSDFGWNLHELVGETSFVADETSLWSHVRVALGLLSVGTPEFDKSTRQIILYLDYGYTQANWTVTALARLAGLHPFKLWRYI